MSTPLTNAQQRELERVDNGAHRWWGMFIRIALWRRGLIAWSDGRESWVVTRNGNMYL